MGLFSLEQSKLTYRIDFVFYSAAVIGLTAFPFAAAPLGTGFKLAALAAAGLLCWSLIEYLLHRFVLHGLLPFSAWHAAHHQRPTALICAPTLLSAALILLLVFMPALWLGDVWLACALTLGVLVGYLGYAITHHATHHWRASNGWLAQRKRWHAAHHHAPASHSPNSPSGAGSPICYGVTSGFWDQVFGSAPRLPRRREAAEALHEAR